MTPPPSAPCPVCSPARCMCLKPEPPEPIHPGKTYDHADIPEREPANVKPRVYFAVWEDLEEGEGGYASGAISTQGGGNIHWDDNQFQVVHKDDYDQLELERDEAVKNWREHQEDGDKYASEILELRKAYENMNGAMQEQRRCYNIEYQRAEDLNRKFSASQATVGQLAQKVTELTARAEKAEWSERKENGKFMAEVIRREKAEVDVQFLMETNRRGIAGWKADKERLEAANLILTEALEKILEPKLDADGEALWDTGTLVVNDEIASDALAKAAAMKGRKE